MTVAGLYARVSTKDQSEESQLVALRQLCRERGWESVEYVDHGISGTREDRPALKRMLDDAARGKVSVVVCWRFDRIARSLTHLLKVLETLHAYNVEFISQQECIDTSTPMGRCMYAIVGAFAALERETIVERVRAGLRRAKIQGTRSGRPAGRPLRVFDRARACEMRQAGDSISAIARAFKVGKGTAARATA